MNVAPDSGYGYGVGFDYDTSMGVTTDKNGVFRGQIYNHYPLPTQAVRKNYFLEN